MLVTHAGMCAVPVAAICVLLLIFCLWWRRRRQRAGSKHLVAAQVEAVSVLAELGTKGAVGRVKVRSQAWHDLRRPRYNTPGTLQICGSWVTLVPASHVVRFRTRILTERASFAGAMGCTDVQG